MSSDTFTIEIRAIDGDTVELLCTTGTAGGYNDLAVTRSFVLMALEDGMPHTRTTPLQQRLVELGGGDIPPLWEAEFHREHVGEFIASTELVERIGIITDQRAWADGRFSSEDEVGERDYPLHRFVVRARMADPRWLVGVKVGSRYGTTAFDAWWDDPTRPSRARLAAVERQATRWRPAKKTAVKKTAVKKTGVKKTVAKTTAAKKTAAKKTAVKKTAAKKTAVKKTAAKKTAAKKTAAKKTAVKKTAVKKTAVKKTAAKKTAAKKTAAKKTAVKKTAVKKTAAKKTAVKKTAAKKTAAKTSA
jgi:hypothetical protein